MVETVVIPLIIFGAVLLILQKVEIDPTVKSIIQIILIAIVVIWAIRILLPMANFG